MRAFWPYAGVTAAAVGLDQWVKALVESGLEMHVKVDVIPFLALFRTYNEGVAFSMFASVGEWGLIVMSLLVAGFVLFLAAKTLPGQVFARVGFALIIGGAIGNLIDRAAYGHVIDYILFHTQTWSFAVFNLADVWISVGAALVILEEFLIWRRARVVAPGGD